MKNIYKKLFAVLVLLVTTLVSAQISETVKATTNWNIYSARTECADGDYVGGICVNVDWGSGDSYGDLIAYDNYLVQQQLKTWFSFQQQELVEYWEEEVLLPGSYILHPKYNDIGDRYEALRERLTKSAVNSFYNTAVSGFYDAYGRIYEVPLSTTKETRINIGIDLATELVNLGGTNIISEFMKYDGIEMPSELGRIVHEYYEAENRLNQSIYLETEKVRITEDIKEMILNNHEDRYDDASVFNKIKIMATYVDYATSGRTNPFQLDNSNIDRLYPSSSEIDDYVEELEEDRLDENAYMNNDFNRANWFDEEYVNSLVSIYPFFIRNSVIATIRKERIKALGYLSGTDHANKYASNYAELVRVLSITDEHEKEWLSYDFQRVNNIHDELSNARNINLTPNPNLDFVYLFTKQLIEERITNGGLVASMIDELGITDEDQIDWLLNRDNLLASIGQLELIELTQDVTPRWVANSGKINGRDNQAYTHTATDGSKTWFLMEDNSVVLLSNTRLLLGKDDRVVTQFSTEANGNQKFWYYKEENTEEAIWHNYLVVEPNSLADELEVFFATGVLELGKAIGTYALPIEDVKVIITGTDFNGQEASQLKAASFMLLAVIPGSKALKAVKTLPSGATKWAIAAVKTNGKATNLTFKLVNGIVEFGGSLAKVINTKVGEEAHHIIAWAMRENRVVQLASKVGFHMNAKINGTALQKFTKLIGEGLHGNHPAYNDFVKFRLDSFTGTTPELAKEYLEQTLIPELLRFIDLAKQSDLNLNEYFKLVVNPNFGL